MPKKKLTKAQVKAKYQQLINITYDLASDKMSHSNSLVPGTARALVEINTKFIQTQRRIK